MTITPDAKDWTWVLERCCEECGFDPESVTTTNLATRLRESVLGWGRRLAAPDARIRPVPSRWSATEYAAHVADVGRIMRGRVESMLATTDPLFDNWDQDATALEERYAQREPDQVMRLLVPAIDALALAFSSVSDDAWERPGRRSNGSRFTVFSLGVYALHDLEHHRHDVGT